MSNSRSYHLPEDHSNHWYKGQYHSFQETCQLCGDKFGNHSGGPDEAWCPGQNYRSMTQEFVGLPAILALPRGV